MNDLRLFENAEFGKVRVLEEKGKVLFGASDIATLLGYSNPRDAVLRHCKGVVKYDIPTASGTQSISFIPEGDVYRLIIRSKLPSAEKFETWLFDEVLPSIRKHGAYMTDNVLEQAIANPDFMIGLLQNLKEEQKKRIEAETKVEEMKREVTHKENVIIGLVGDIDLATKRQRITQIVRKGADGNYRERYQLLYSEFERKYHVDLSRRMNNCEEMKPKIKNKMDYIDRVMNMTPQLYEVTCKLFENDVEVLKKEWEDNI